MYPRLNRKILSVVTFWLMISCVFAQDDCSLETFALSPMYNDLKPEDRPVKSIKVLNRMECATHCYRQVRCTGFIVSSEDSVCSMYDRRLHSMIFINESGGRAYETTSGDPSNCFDVLLRGFHSDGVYKVKASDSGQPMKVFCEVSSSGDGWLVIQRRTDGSVDFYRTWKEYSYGFGDLNNEFWLGNTNIHQITSQGYYDLKIDLEDFEGNTRYAIYKNFSISSKTDFFRLSIGAYSGDAGDSLSYHNGNRFSAKDVDLDTNTSKHCAIDYKGAWWYGACHDSNLNGRYLKGRHSTTADGVNWRLWLGHQYSLKKTVMKIRPMKF